MSLPCVILHVHATCIHVQVLSLLVLMQVLVKLENHLSKVHYLDIFHCHSCQIVECGHVHVTRIIYAPPLPCPYCTQLFLSGLSQIFRDTWQLYTVFVYAKDVFALLHVYISLVHVQVLRLLLALRQLLVKMANLTSKVCYTYMYLRTLIFCAKVVLTNVSKFTAKLRM